MRGRDLDEVLSEYMVLEGALSIRDIARRLVVEIADAEVALPGGVATHPLAGTERMAVDVPFGFAVAPARWKGVNPRAIVDFAIGLGAPDAEAFLKTVVSNPGKWFRDISSLDTALLRLAASRDAESFMNSVAKWNAAQDVAIPFVDRTVLVPAVWATSEDAVLWGNEFKMSADGLVGALLSDRWHWFEL